MKIISSCANASLLSGKAPVFLIMIMAALMCFPPVSFPQVKKKKEITHDISVTAISLAVSVQDKKGRYITDLTEEDFTVYENGKRKDITYFSHDFDAPLSLTVLLDVSGSMAIQDKLEESKEALRYLTTILLDDEDEISLLIFADEAVEVAAPFSKEKKESMSVLEKTEAYGQTALNDAVAVSPEFANRGINEKRALVLITDGIENDSRYSPEQAIEAARRVDIPIYTIGYKIPLSERYIKKYKVRSGLSPSSIIDSLHRFSEATGGKAYFIDRPLELKNALRLIKRELSHQYIIGYTSYTDLRNDFRRIKVVTKKKKYRVRTREGYFAGEKKDNA